MDRAATIEGVIERFVFQNDENGYVVARLQEAEKETLTTVVGTLPGVRVGENVQLHGVWKRHPRYGEQFDFESYRVTPPSTLKGIQRYLSSGFIQGIGKKTAERLIRHFGLDVIEVIDKTPDRLREIQGIGKKKTAQILASWQEHRDQRNIMVFLQSYGVTPTQGQHIVKEYGAEAIAVIRSNPYQLSRDILGIGFRTADRIAQNLGIPSHSNARVDAGILYVLQELAEEGHVCYPRDGLLDEAQRILEVERPVIEEALERQAGRQEIVIEGGQDARVYLTRYHVCEVAVARRIQDLLGAPAPRPAGPRDQAVRWFEQKSGLRLSEGQKEAIGAVLSSQVAVITGGPGVGKTTVVNAILKILQDKAMKVVLAAPTGRAAKRLSESTQWPAKTIHRLLRFNPALHRFDADEDNPLEGDVFVIDECSMIDVVLMHHLLKALPSRARLVLVGDADQLPSVGPGNVLRDILASGRVPTARLNVIFRQAARSTIVEWAHAVNRGQIPHISRRPREDLSDLYFIEKEEPEEILRLMIHLCTERIPQRFGFHPARDIQVLTPMHKGVLGVSNLNAELQKVLNPPPALSSPVPSGFRDGDKVMQVRNNYEREVFNGDIGFVSAIESGEARMTIRFDEREVDYPFSSVHELVPAYAISVHKSQGSEYPAVVLPLVTQHFVLLQRNLLYTAITRARQLAVIVGTQRALRIAVQDATVSSRFTGLRERLESSARPLGTHGP